MVFHLAGFLQDQDCAGAFASVTPLSDDRIFTSGNDLRVPSLSQVVLIAAGADTTVAPRVRLDSPTLSMGTLPEITPVNGGTSDIEPRSPPAAMPMLTNPMR